MKMNNKKSKKNLIRIISGIIAFATTYSLILPAITIDEETAEDEPGIVLTENDEVQELAQYDNEQSEAAEVIIEESPEVTQEEETPVEEIQSEESEPEEEPVIEELKTGEEQVVVEEQEVTDVSEESETKEAESVVEQIETVETAAEQKTEETEEVPEVSYPAAELEGGSNGVTVKVKAPEGAFPEGTTMTVKTVSEAEVLDTVTDTVNKEIKAVQAVDIIFKDKDGKEIEPLVPIQVSMVSDEIGKAEASEVVHIDEEGKGEIVEQNSGSKDNEVVFESDSFSVYVIVYTVDFHYEVDGKTYDYSIEGGSCITLSELVRVLKVIEDDPATEMDEVWAFVKEVKEIKFSTPELVYVSKAAEDTTAGKIKADNSLECEYSAELTEEKINEINSKTVKADDYALISLRPFTTNEILTVTMNNGNQFEVKVTDAQIKTYVISDSGDTYAITVTYDETTGIPADAQLQARLLNEKDERYQEDIDRSNAALLARYDQEAINPLVFEIKILANGKEIEPLEGTKVSVNISLAMELMAEQPQNLEKNVGNETTESSRDKNAGEGKTEQSSIMIGGMEYTIEPTGVDLSETRVVHLTEDGDAEIIDDLNSSVDADNNVVVSFETESFSDYTVQGVNNNNGLNGLPNTIYVGDEIYLQNSGNVWATNIGTVVSETKHNNRDDYKVIRATSPGTFKLVYVSNPSYPGNWQNSQGKTITVLPARSEGNNGQPYSGTTPPGTINTVNNADIGVKLNLFDYDLDDYLDDRFDNYDFAGWGADQTYQNNVLNAFLNHGINNGHALKFWGSGITNGRHGNLNNYVEHGVTSIVEKNLAGGTGGYPKLAGYNETLQYLFDPAANTGDREVYQNVDGLFKKQGDYYVYNSNENYAYYDKSQGSNGSFVVYDSTYEQKSRDIGGEQANQTNGKAIGFFPFHEWDKSYDLFINWNKNLNHHFGMSMSVDFSLPKAPKAVKDTNGKDIVFEFSGDDDLWVFIDGKLAMDIGGIHQPTSGTINFTQKKVTVNGKSQSFNFSGLYDGKKHTMQVFYIERGGCDSNCMIKFNMTQYGDVEFDKVDEDDDSKLLAGAVFGLYKDPACRQPLTETLDADHGGVTRSFTVETDENGHAKLADVPLGDYYLKEIHAPDGYPITVGAEVARVRVYLDENGNVKASVNGAETGAKITNKKPSPINLGLKKEWQDEDEQTISAPDGVTATFEIKRMRTYEIHTEEKIEGEGKNSSHLTVGWIHNNRPYEYEEFDLVADSQVTVSWSYASGYEGSIGYRLNGTDHTKSPNPNNIYSQAFTMPSAGQTAVFYILDYSENGDAINGINVAGSQFYGNSGGGYIHQFHKITEPDSEFTCTCNNVTDNKVTLPIGESTWHYTFDNLPSFGTGTVSIALEDGGEVKDYDVSFRYSYYLEEVSSTAPEGTTVKYKDLNGNEINSPTDAETSVSGTETIINRVPFGYLKIEKKVTYNGSSNNLTAEQKSKLAGTYKFKIYTKQQCGVADAVQDPNAPAEAEDKDLIISIVIGEDGQAVSSDAIKLLAGSYWIKEVESSNPMMFPVNNPIEVPVTKDNTSTSAAISTLTNNYDENNGPDKISIDIEKKFQGLDLISQIPADFQVTLVYKVGNEQKEVILGNSNATGPNGETIAFTTKVDGFTWHWHVGNINTDAKDFKIKESNYDKAKGYDWKKAYLDNVEITDTVNEFHNLNVTAPSAELSDVTNDRRTSDSGNNTMFYLDDTDVLLSKLTANKGTLVISKHPLNLVERDAVKKGLPNQFKDTCIFYSMDEHPNGFQFQDGKENKKVTFGETDGRATVKFTQAASAQESVWLVTYSSQEARNNANLRNTYEEIPITIDIIKVDKNNTSKKLKGAVFTIRQIADEAPENGNLKTLAGTSPRDSVPTDDNGKTSFGNLTHGYYELTEKTAPDGYILSDKTTSYFAIESGVVKWLVKGTNKPSEWIEKKEKLEGEMVDFEEAHLSMGAQPATNASFEVENEPGAALPSTGGSGTNMFYFFGIMMISLAAGACLVMKRRQKNTA